MKRLPIVILSLILLLNISKAIPIISNISVNPNSLWLGESANISLNCMDDLNNTINKVYLNASGPDIFISDWNMNNLGNNNYSLEIDESYLYKTGDYQVNVYCENNLKEIGIETISFKISQLTSEISKISPDPAYLGDEIEINAFVKKDEAKLSSRINFTVKIGNYEKNFNQDPPPIYDGQRDGY